MPVSGTAEKTVGEKSANPETLGQAPNEEGMLQLLPKVYKTSTLLEKGN